MNKFLRGILAVMVMTIVACDPKREVVEIYKGEPGTSCSVSPELGEEQEILGARVSCTDGTFAIILNGTRGLQGLQGLQGIQGPVGEAAESCQAYRSHFFNGVWLSCPGQFPVLISDGRDGDDGEDGRDGRSCSVAQLNNGAKITCGNSHAYVFNGVNGINGSNGTNGTSCTVVREEENNRAKITCGASVAYVYDGEEGDQGAPGNASLFSISMTSSCKVIDDSNSAKLNGSSSEIKLYSTTDCSGSSNSLQDGEVAVTDNGNLLFNVDGTNTLKLLKSN